MRKPRAICYRCGKSVCVKRHEDGNRVFHNVYFSHFDKQGEWCSASEMDVRPAATVECKDDDARA